MPAHQSSSPGPGPRWTTARHATPAWCPFGNLLPATSVAENRPPPTDSPRLLDQVRLTIRRRHYSRRTEKAYVSWIRRFILFHAKRHPAGMGENEVARYLSHLAARGRVSASTQNQALSAILFLYRHVLRQEIGWIEGVKRVKESQRVPVVLTRCEVNAILRQLSGSNRLIASLLYGAGMRLLECLRLRIKDIDLERGELIVRDGKGRKDRVTLMPRILREPLTWSELVLNTREIFPGEQATLNFLTRSGANIPAPHESGDGNGPSPRPPVHRPAERPAPPTPSS